MTENATKTAAILIIGDEVLSGRTQDTNTQTIAKALGEKGIAVVETRTIPDVVTTIAAVVNELRARVDYLFTTGGIGPTHDDRTAESMAQAFGVALEENAEARARLVAHYGGAEHMNEGRIRMTRVPVGASLIDNPVSVAPGFRMDNVFVMAGVPSVMKGMLDSILPNLVGGALIHSRSVTTDLPESVIASALEAIEQAHPGVSLGSYPRFQLGASASVTVVARGTDIDLVNKAVESVANMIKEKGKTPLFT